MRTAFLLIAILAIALIVSEVDCSAQQWSGIRTERPNEPWRPYVGGSSYDYGYRPVYPQSSYDYGYRYTYRPTYRQPSLWYQPSTTYCYPQGCYQTPSYFFFR